MTVLNGERVLLGITGGIAAYKSADLVRRLKQAGAEVRVVMTQSAEQFITATTLQALSGNPVRSSLWDESAEAAMSHIELARWASKVLRNPMRRSWPSFCTACSAADLSRAISRCPGWAHAADKPASKQMETKIRWYMATERLIGNPRAHCASRQAWY